MWTSYVNTAIRSFIKDVRRAKEIENTIEHDLERNKNGHQAMTAYLLLPKFKDRLH